MKPKPSNIKTPSTRHFLFLRRREAVGYDRAGSAPQHWHSTWAFLLFPSPLPLPKSSAPTDTQSPAPFLKGKAAGDWSQLSWAHLRCCSGVGRSTNLTPGGIYNPTAESYIAGNSPGWSSTQQITTSTMGTPWSRSSRFSLLIFSQHVQSQEQNPVLKLVKALIFFAHISSYRTGCFMFAGPGCAQPEQGRARSWPSESTCITGTLHNSFRLLGKFTSSSTS